MNLLTKVILPLLGMLFWLYVSYLLVLGPAGEVELLTWWIVAGCPFGIFRMRSWLVPTGAASPGQALFILIVDLVLGGLLGGFVVVINLVKIFANLVRFIFHQEME